MMFDYGKIGVLTKKSNVKTKPIQNKQICTFRYKTSEYWSANRFELEFGSIYVYHFCILYDSELHLEVGDRINIIGGVSALDGRPILLLLLGL